MAYHRFWIIFKSVIIFDSTNFKGIKGLVSRWHLTRWFYSIEKLSMHTCIFIILAFTLIVFIYPWSFLLLWRWYFRSWILGHHACGSVTGSSWNIFWEASIIFAVLLIIFWAKLSVNTHWQFIYSKRSNDVEQREGQRVHSRFMCTSMQAIR